MKRCGAMVVLADNWASRQAVSDASGRERRERNVNRKTSPGKREFDGNGARRLGSPGSRSRPAPVATVGPSSPSLVPASLLEIGCRGHAGPLKAHQKLGDLAV